MLSRRDFIRRSLQAASLSAFGSLPILDLASSPVAFAATGAVELSIRKGEDIPALVRETVAALGGMQRFVKPNETVVLKPNIGWDRTVEQAANTHPQIVATVARLCLEAGAGRVRVFDRTCNDPRRCYVQSGIAAAVEALADDRVNLEHMDRRGYQEIGLKDGVALQKWEFYKPALDADRLINLPIAKDHSISTLTLGMKNIMGVIGGNRGILHRNIDQALADINSVVHSDLTIIDATRILIANGPQGGDLDDVRKLDTLIASADIVAADSYAATLFGFRPDQIPTIVAGAQRGLGVMDLTKVQKV